MNSLGTSGGALPSLSQVCFIRLTGERRPRRRLQVGSGSGPSFTQSSSAVLCMVWSSTARVIAGAPSLQTDQGSSLLTGSQAMDTAWHRELKGGRSPQSLGNWSKSKLKMAAVSSVRPSTDLGLKNVESSWQGPGTWCRGKSAQILSWEAHRTALRVKMLSVCRLERCFHHMYL